MKEMVRNPMLINYLESKLDDYEDDQISEILNRAASNGYFQVVQLLLSKRDFNHETLENALRNAVKYSKPPQLLEIDQPQNYYEVVRLLKSKGANINAGDENGTTPLMIAAANGKKDMAKLLIDTFGANIDAQDNSIRTALDYARNNGKMSVFKMLEGIQREREPPSNPSSAV